MERASSFGMYALSMRDQITYYAEIRSRSTNREPEVAMGGAHSSENRCNRDPGLIRTIGQSPARRHTEKNVKFRTPCRRQTFSSERLSVDMMMMMTMIGLF
ncbi:jg12055 [Pararge aegeria aegeria]|uniref:Jg12055 protein n=1 Tax=Pararge aegeria aegeria TaxID=348720 RepID=A0A8S4R3C3_9NEOP|nr:jg12055 [Pararge aegeria aegeria]